LNLKRLIGLLALMTLASCGPAAKNPQTLDNKLGEAILINNVALMDSNHILTFDDLPLEGSLESSRRLWSGDHWPFNRGSINRRWNASSDDEIKRNSPTKDEFLEMSEEEVAKLSPSEKFDLFMGNYDYPLTKEVSSKLNPFAADWEGIGNGWTVASAFYEEPGPTILPNPDGIKIPFGSSDIKALLSYYYAFGPELPFAQFLGLRCTENTDCVNDLNAGSFHIAITNKIGIRKQYLFADIDPYQEVWNYPLHSYKSEVIDEKENVKDVTKGISKILAIKTKIYYVDRATSNSWTPVKETELQKVSNRIYQYELHLNERGEIIDGKWKYHDRPDFIWTMPAVNKFRGMFEGMQVLLR
jgi:hypothetical protein